MIELLKIVVLICMACSFMTGCNDVNGGSCEYEKVDGNVRIVALDVQETTGAAIVTFDWYNASISYNAEKRIISSTCALNKIYKIDSIYPCQRWEIAKGSCTPVIYKPAADTNCAFE